MKKILFILKNILIIYIAYSQSLFADSGPPNGMPGVISTNDYGDIIGSTTIVEADGYYFSNNSNLPRYNNTKGVYNQWINSGIALTQGQVFTIDIAGTVARNYNAIVGFDPTISAIQNTNIKFKAGDSIWLSISPTFSDGSSALNYVNQGYDLFCDKPMNGCSNVCLLPPYGKVQCTQTGVGTSSKNWSIFKLPSCNFINSNYQCTLPDKTVCNLQDGRECKTANGTSAGTWSINGAGLNILYNNSIINDQTKQFSEQISAPINSSLGVGGFFSYQHYAGSGFNITNLIEDGVLQFQAVDNGSFSNNIGNYAFEINKVFNLVNNARAPRNTYGTLDYTIFSSDPNNDSSYITNNLNLVAGTSYNTSAYGSGSLWFRVHDDSEIVNFTNLQQSDQLIYFNKVFENSFPTNVTGQFSKTGRYSVNIQSNITNTDLSDRITNIVNPVKQAITKAGQSVYVNIISNPSFQNMVKSSITLYIIIYAIMFMFGMIQVTQTDLVNRIFKMGCLFALISTDTSWNFFNQFVFNAFQNGNSYLIGLVTGGDPSTSQTNSFRFIDISLGQFFTRNTWVKFFALICAPSPPYAGIISGPFVGMIISGMMIYGVLVYAMCVIEMILGYLVGVIAVSFTISIAPILISCILFERTKGFFDNWVKYLFNFSMQPVIIFGTVYLVYNLVLLSFQEAIGYNLVWQCAIPINILGLNYCIDFYVPDKSLLDMFVSALMFIIYIKMLKSMLDFAPTVTNYIFGTNSGAVNLTGSRSQAGQQIAAAKKLLKKAIHLDKAEQGLDKLEGKSGGGANEGISAEGGGEGAKGGGGGEGGSGKNSSSGISALKK